MGRHWSDGRSLCETHRHRPRSLSIVALGCCESRNSVLPTGKAIVDDGMDRLEENVEDPAELFTSAAAQARFYLAFRWLSEASFGQTWFPGHQTSWESSWSVSSYKLLGRTPSSRERSPASYGKALADCHAATLLPALSMNARSGARRRSKGVHASISQRWNSFPLDLKFCANSSDRFQFRGSRLLSRRQMQKARRMQSMFLFGVNTVATLVPFLSFANFRYPSLSLWCFSSPGASTPVLITSMQLVLVACRFVVLVGTQTPASRQRRRRKWWRPLWRRRQQGRRGARRGLQGWTRPRRRPLLLWMRQLEAPPRGACRAPPPLPPRATPRHL